MPAKIRWDGILRQRRPACCARCYLTLCPGQYRKQSSFNISSQKQARQIVDVIERWYAGAPEGADQPAAASIEEEA